MSQKFFFFARTVWWYGFLNCNENEQIKKRSLFTSTGWWRQFNGFYYSLGAISSHAWPSVTRGWKWLLVRDKNHFIFFSPVTVNKYSLKDVLCVSTIQQNHRDDQTLVTHYIVHTLQGTQLTLVAICWSQQFTILQYFLFEGLGIVNQLHVLIVDGNLITNFPRTTFVQLWIVTGIIKL